MFEAALGTAVCILLVAFRFGIRRIAGYATAFDVSITALLMYMFTGTYAGMMTGILAGGIISVFLNFTRRTLGVERLKLIKLPGERMARFRWVSIPPGQL